jgi:hypothetical protein
VVLLLHDFSFHTPDELLAALTKSNGSQSAMPKSGMGSMAMGSGSMGAMNSGTMGAMNMASGTAMAAREIGNAARSTKLRASTAPSRLP